MAANFQKMAANIVVKNVVKNGGEKKSSKKWRPITM
jgi:hypothetical protein